MVLCRQKTVVNHINNIYTILKKLIYVKLYKNYLNDFQIYNDSIFLKNK